MFVDRGWVANADAAADLPEVPPPPTGEVTLVGWLRSGEPDLGKDLPAGQLASIDLAEAARQTGGGTVLDAYLVLDSEQPGGPRPAPLAAPDTDLGPHQAYAIQWWLTSVFGLVLLGYRLRLPSPTAASSPGGAESRRRSGSGTRRTPSFRQFRSSR